MRYGIADDTSGANGERAPMDTRRYVAAVPKVTAPLVDTRTIGEALSFIGEHRDWPEWSFQFTVYMGSANPKSIEALRSAAMQDAKITAAAVVQQSIEEHNAQRYLALALLCKGSALVSVKDTEANNEFEAWRALNATFDSNNKGCQRVRMQYLLQPKRAESILQTTEAVERCWNATSENTNRGLARRWMRTSRYVSYSRWHHCKCRTTATRTHTS